MNFPSAMTFSDALGKVFEFETFESLISFFKSESDYWTKAAEAVTAKGRAPSVLLNSAMHTTNLMNTLIAWQAASTEWDPGTLSANLRSLQSSQLAQLTGQWLWSGHSFIPAWVDAYNFSQGTGDGFIEPIVGKTANSAANFEYLRGYILAYEFLMKDESLITKRRGAERASFNTIKDQLVDTKSELTDKVVKYQNDIDLWKSKLTDGIEQWEIKHKKDVDDTTLRHSKEFQERLSTWNERTLELENLYQEKLRLNSPASYWGDSAKKFKKQGFYWIGALVLVTATSITYFSYFFVSWLLGFKTDVKLNTLEGIILFGVIISSYAVLIRAFSRLSFSAFHLQRDSEEREQLTHLYLALSKETDIDSDSRNIVLQALFSRTETGLLANENGPAMPGIHDIVSSLTKKS